MDACPGRFHLYCTCHYIQRVCGPLTSASLSGAIYHVVTGRHSIYRATVVLSIQGCGSALFSVLRSKQSLEACGGRGGFSAHLSIALNATRQLSVGYSGTVQCTRVSSSLK